MSKEDIEILEEIIRGNEDCIATLNKKDFEDIEHYKREIKAIKNMINSYNKEKARADKLEKEYSKILTRIDEYEVENITATRYKEIRRQGYLEGCAERDKLAREICKECCKKHKKDSIPKAKVKEKIKGLDKKIKSNEKELKKNPDPVNSKFDTFDEYFKWENKVLKENELLKHIIQILQELLKNGGA